MNYAKVSPHYNCKNTNYDKNGNPTSFTGNYYYYADSVAAKKTPVAWT